MNDPSAAFYAPPPRYLLESDSSDEEGQGDYAGSHPHHAIGSSSKSTPLAAAVAGWDSSKAISHAIVGVGQAGRYLYRKFGLSGQDGAEVQLNKRPAGIIVLKAGCAVISLEEQDGAEAWAVLRALVDAVTAEKWCVCLLSKVTLSCWDQR